MHRHTSILTITLLMAAAIVGIAHASVPGSAQRFTFSSKTVRGTDLPIHVSAVGAIAARGTARLVEHPNTTTGAFVFPRGDLNIRFVHGPTHAHPDLANCRATIDARGTYTIRGGTGPYARANGTGTYTETRILIGQRNSTGACIGGPNSTPASVTVVARMVGTVALS